MQKQRILVLPNEKKDQGLAHTKRLLGLLRGRAEVFVPPEMARQLEAPAISRDMLGSVDLAVTLGGDGTIISRARMLLGYEIPLLGVNLGRLGYLAQVEPGGMEQAVEHVAAGRYGVERRILLEGQVHTGQGQVRSPFTAFNEALIHRSTASKLLRIRVGLNG